MSNSNMVQITGYVDKNDIPKIIKKRGSRGMISWSSYIRYLVERDIGKITSEAFTD